MRSRAGNREIAKVPVPQALGYDREVRFTLPLGGTITIATTPMIVINPDTAFGEPGERFRRGIR